MKGPSTSWPNGERRRGELPPIKMPRVDMGPALRGIRDAQQTAPQQP